MFCDEYADAACILDPNGMPLTTCECKNNIVCAMKAFMQKLFVKFATYLFVNKIFCALSTPIEVFKKVTLSIGNGSYTTEKTKK